MARRSSKHRLVEAVRASVRQGERRFRPSLLECLEDRTMLDGGLPVAIVVGRVQSVPEILQKMTVMKPAYSIADVQATHTLILTITAYNEQANDETGVLLTDTLAPGVSIVSADVQPDQQGQNLAFSLGTISGFDRKSVTLTLGLPDPIPNQIDTGAQVYATLDAGMVSNSTPAAALRAGSLDAGLLGYDTNPAHEFAFSTDIYDPFVQEEAAKLSYSSTQIFNFLQTQIVYNSYAGSLRGARGTLWSNAGNALDVANLGVDLERASGNPAQYVSGTLAKADAQTLILSMFPASYQTVGYIPAGTQISDPANDPQLLAETESHYWFQFDNGSGMKDADPLFPTAVIGQTFTASTGTFTLVPDTLRQTTEVRLQAEMYNQGDFLAPLLGQSPLSKTVVLDKIFNDADLVGRPLSIGNFVSTSEFSLFFLQRTTNTYSPYINMGDEAYPDGSHDDILRGLDVKQQDYQEVITNFPLETQVLTGLFLNVTLTAVDGGRTALERTLFDRIGYATRQNGGTPSLTFDPSAPPALSDMDFFTVNVLSGASDSRVIAHADRELSASATNLTISTSSASPGADETLDRQAAINATRDALATALALSTRFIANLASITDVTTYFDQPRVTLVATRESDANSPSTFSLDLTSDTIRALVFPGQNKNDVQIFNFQYGLVEAAVESATLPADQPNTVANVGEIFDRANSAGIPIVFLTPSDVSSVEGLALSAQAKARITIALLNGFDILTPASTVPIGAASIDGWYQITPNSAQLVAVLADGMNGEEEYPVALSDSSSRAALLAKRAQDLKRLRTLVNDLQSKPNFEIIVHRVKGILKSTTDAVARLAYIHAFIKLLEDAANLSPSIDTAFVTFAFETAIELLLLIPGDPPIGPFLVRVAVPETDNPAEVGQGQVTLPSNILAGATAAEYRTPNLAISAFQADAWDSTSSSSLEFDTAKATDSKLVDSSGVSVGSGDVSYISASTRATISGVLHYSLRGTGTLSFYGPAEKSLGVSGDWQNYSATVTGDVSITLTVPGGALTLNGQHLPAGTYTITTSLATLSGSGATSSPNFSGSVAITATNGAIELGPGMGTLSVGGKPLDTMNETTLTGYSGTVNVSANGDGTDSVALNGNAGNVLQVVPTPATLTTDRNTPKTFTANVQTSFADTYTLTANAPVGWTVTIDANGNVTATPAPGLQGGTYPIQIIAQSTTNPDLIAQNIVHVTITPTLPGLTLNVASDPIFTVPFNGAQLPTAFGAQIQNVGPASDTYNLTFSNVPAGFTLLNSGTSVAVPAGQTGILGLYLQPNLGQPIPLPNTPLSFTVTATSTTNPALTKSQVVSFIVPKIEAVTVTSDSSSLTSTSGSSASTVLHLTNVGNVAETVNLAATLPPGVTAGSFNPVTLQPGQTITETLTLTPDSTVSLNQPVNVTITASYGSTPLTTTTTVSLVVRSAQVVAIQQAAVALASLTGSQVGLVLSELADSLAQLQGSPTSAPILSRVQFLLVDLSTSIQADPAVASFATGLQPLQTAANAGDVNGLLGQTAAFFNSLTPVLTQEADQQFTASLSPTETDLAPGQGTTFNLQLASQSNDPISLTLGVATLPNGVTVTPGQTQVTLAPNQTMTVPVTLSQSIQSTKVFTLDVTATASLVHHDATAVVAIRPAAADVLSVTASPNVVNVGDRVTVSAQVFNTANAARSVLAHVDILDQTSAVVASLADVPVTLTSGTDSQDVTLGSFATADLASGFYTLRVGLRIPDGSPLPGRTAMAPLIVGIPVTASVTASEQVLPPGTSTVTTTIQAQNATNVNNGGSGQTIYNNAADFSIAGNPSGAWSYGYLSPGASPDSSTFTRYGNPVDSGGLEEWSTPSNPPAVFDNPTNGVLFYGTGQLQPGEAGFHPGPNGEYSIYRFTAPSTGSYSLRTTFTGIDHAGGTTTDVHVLDDGKSLFQGNINGYLDKSSYAATLNLSAGDIIDFAVGYGSDKGYLFDSTGLDATLTLNGVSSGETFVLYYTQYQGSENVKKAVVNYDGTNFTIGTKTTIAGGFPGDGLVFAPDGSLIVAGVGAVVRKVNPITGAIATASTGGPGAFHLALDPTGKFVYSADQPGRISVIPLDPFGTGTPHTVTGDDTGVAALAFDSAGVAYYTTGNGGNDSNANFGLIDLSTFTTHRIIRGLVAAHGITFDPFTGDMIVVGDSHVAQIDLKTMTIVSSLDLSSRGSFQLDQGTADGHGHLFVCDNFGRLLFVDYSKTGLVGDPSDFVATPAFDSFPDDVAPLSSLGALSALLEVQHFLPPSGYTVTGSTITPMPGSVSPTEIDWLGGLLSGTSTPQQFQLTGQVTNLAPGEVRPISQGTSLTVQFTTAVGQQLQSTITLPPVVVAGEHIISLSPPAQTVDKNATATYVVTLTNPLATSETYTLSTTGLDGLTTNLAASVVVPADQSVTTPLTVTVPTSASEGTRVFLVSITTTDGAADSAEGQLTVSPTVAIPTEAVNLQLTPAQQTVGLGTSTTFDLLVTNVGDVSSTYSLSGVFPANVGAVFTPPSITVAPGESNARHISLKLSALMTATLGSFPFSGSAVSTTDPNAKSTANATLVVVNLGVQVMLTPSPANPGDTLQLKVTNSGTVADTYSLKLGGPAALVSSLAVDHVSLDAGASIMVPITTSAVNFAVQGSLILNAAAISQTNPAIQSDATSALNIPKSFGLASSLDPAVKVLRIPGTTDFLLMVDNTGTAEDSYNAVITGTSGPLTASLMGLDGNPTQTIPLFRLPGLSTGAILIHTGIATAATGTVTVRVTSMTNSSMTASQTATLTALASTATTTHLTIAPNPAAVGEPITFIAVVAPATGTGTPTGAVTFTLDGTAQAPVTLQVVNGQDEATFTTSTFDTGPHTVSASYGGDPQFTPSMAGPSTLTVNAQPPTLTTSSGLLLTPNPSTVGQMVTFTAIVSPTAGTTTPTGTVTFRIDGAAQVPVALQVVGGRDVATFTTSTLSVGSHTIAASYSGDSQFGPSTANPMVEVVATGSSDGPRVADLQRFGFHEMPTTLVLTFDGPLNAARAQNTDNYIIVDPHGHRLAITSATYDAATESVVIRTQRRLNVHRRYRLTVVGTGPDGISGGDGLLLDGNGKGVPGSDYHSVVDRSKLVIGVPTPNFFHAEATTKTRRPFAHKILARHPGQTHLTRSDLTPPRTSSS